MYLQAYEYEQINNVKLDEFFSKIDQHNFEPEIKKWIDELLEIRNGNRNVLPLDSNLNTILKHYLPNFNKLN